ncbi:MAG: DUF3137 domain-containing protein [Clostridia bacterium]|nr:DUF3137 domain-containing protein [Clostridia bacterium]
MEKDFESFYSKCINENELNDIWKNTKQEKKRRKLISIPLILTVDLLLIFCFTNIFSNFGARYGLFPYIFIIPPILIIDVFILAIISLAFSKKTRLYNDVFKEKVMDKIFRNFLNDADYIPKKEMPQSIYREGKYDGYYNRYYSDDYVEGNIDDKYLIKMAEVTTEHEKTTTDSDGNTHTETTTIFSGLFAKINIGKSIKTELRIGTNRTISKKKRLEMDSDEFEKYFDVSSTNDIVGMQILTHDIMDMLVDFRNKLKMPLDILIRDDMMYIRLHVGKMFEAKFNKNAVIDKQILQRYFDIVNFIYSLSKKMIKTIEETET